MAILAAAVRVHPSALAVAAARQNANGRDAWPFRCQPNHPNWLREKQDAAAEREKWPTAAASIMATNRRMTRVEQDNTFELKSFYTCPPAVGSNETTARNLRCAQRAVD